MFPARFFAPRFFAPRFWAKVGLDITTPTGTIELHSFKRSNLELHTEKRGDEELPGIKR